MSGHVGSKADIRSNDGSAVSPKYLQMAQKLEAGGLKLNRDLDSQLASTAGLGPAHAI